MPVICDNCGVGYGEEYELARCDNCLNEVCAVCTYSEYSSQGRLRGTCTSCYEDELIDAEVDEESDSQDVEAQDVQFD